MFVQQTLILAAFAQVLLTLYAIVRLGLARVACIKRGELTMAQVALSDALWPEPVQKLQANVRNQFETPVLFFAGVSIALGTGSVNAAIVLFAWIFVMSRIIHHLIHVGSNRVGKRFYTYVVGLISIAGLWIALVFEALSKF